PVVALDLVDRRQHLPRDPVLGPGGLVDRQQEGRDAELLDEEVRDAERRRTGGGGGEGRVLGRGAAIGVGEQVGRGRVAVAGRGVVGRGQLRPHRGLLGPAGDRGLRGAGVGAAAGRLTARGRGRGGPGGRGRLRAARRR